MARKSKRKGNYKAPLIGALRRATRVLLVEDDPVTRWLVRTALKDQCTFVTAPNANQALSMVKACEPDIVFLDIGLPDRDGESVLDWIRDHDPGTRVIMFTHQDSPDTIERTIDRGASGFIIKPFRRDDLLRYVHGG